MIEGVGFHRQPYALTLLMIKIPASLLAFQLVPAFNKPSNFNYRRRERGRRTHESR